MTSAEKVHKAGETRPIKTTPVTTKTLANNGGLEELLKKIAGVSLNDPPVTRGATEQPLFVPLERVDNNLQVFLAYRTRREMRSFSYSRLCNYCNLQWIHWERTRNWWVYRCKYYSTCSQRHATLENISSSMGVTTNARIMHKLTNTRKLSGMAQIADYHSIHIM